MLPQLLPLVALALALPAFVLAVDDDVINAVSFRAPYNSFDREGKRQIPNFSFGGNTELNENFIRLTPDRAVRRARAMYCAVLPFCVSLVALPGRLQALSSDVLFWLLPFHGRVA